MWIKKPKNITKTQGIAFGIMDGVVNVLGVLLSLNIATQSKPAVIAGVLAAGLANALANSSGFYVSEETEDIHTKKEIIQASLMAFFSSFLSAFFVLLPTIFLSLKTGLWLGILIGIILLFTIGDLFSHKERKIAAEIGLKYVSIGLIVAFIGFLIGLLVNKLI